MAFVWTHSISAGVLVEAGALGEMQDNLDFIDDNLACTAECSVDNATENDTVQSSNLVGQDTTAYTGLCSGADSAYDLLYNTDVQLYKDNSC